VKSPIFYVPVCFLFFFMTILPAESLAESIYRPQVPVEIRAVQRLVEIPGSDPTDVRYTIAVVESNLSRTLVRFSKEGSEGPAGHLIFYPFSREVSWEGAGISGKQLKDEHLLIIPGSPIPMNVLPVNLVLQKSEPVEYKIQSKAGGRTFVEGIRVSAYMVTREQALRAGWLHNEGEVSSELHLVEAVDADTGDFLVKQLWENSGSWWLYEETLYRRSWRLR